MKKIYLYKHYKKTDQFTLVDDEYYSFLNTMRWRLSSNGYVKTTSRAGSTIFMHRLVNKTPNDLITDHINRDKLDNRKENLRSVDRFTNIVNTGLFKHNKSGIKGVCWNKKSAKWSAQIQLNYRTIHLGMFKDIESAKKSREQAEKLYHGI